MRICVQNPSVPWFSLRWRHNGRHSVSNHQPHHCLLSRLFRRRSKKTSKLRVTGLCVGNSPGAGEFPAQMTSKAENVSIWWRHHVLHMWCHYLKYCYFSHKRLDTIRTLHFNSIPIEWHRCNTIPYCTKWCSVLLEEVMKLGKLTHRLFNVLDTTQIGRNCANDIFKWIFSNELLFF